MIKVEIFDVGHGACNIITCPNGARIMIDCGSRPSPPWFPSVELGGNRTELLVISNFDEDHVSDLPAVHGFSGFNYLITNPTITSEALEAMKAEGGMGRGVSYANRLLRLLGPGACGWPDLGGVQLTFYWNRYGFDFNETNNLSLVTFVRFGSFNAFFGGDLEVEGWRSLLRVPGFIADLSRVNMFVASHHGRANGCCEEVFRFCRPDVFVLADDEIRYGTQCTGEWYGRRAVGIRDFGLPADPVFGYHYRRVLTTRRDGTISTIVWPDGSWLVFSAFWRRIIEQAAGGWGNRAVG